MGEQIAHHLVGDFGLSGIAGDIMGTCLPVNMSNSKPQTPAPKLSDAPSLDAAADQAIAACAREAAKALLFANEFLESELATRVSRGYTRCVTPGRFNRIQEREPQ